MQETAAEPQGTEDDIHEIFANLSEEDIAEAIRVRRNEINELEALQQKKHVSCDDTYLIVEDA